MYLSMDDINEYRLPEAFRPPRSPGFQESLLFADVPVE
jgi:hypothetical protein